MNLEAGKIYHVSHCRKGNFTMQVTDVGETWIGGTLIEGQTNAMLQENIVYEGEPLTVRASFCTFTEVDHG